jgi:hypothetical protein
MTAKTGGYPALAGRIAQTLMDIDRIVQRAELLSTKSRSTGDEGHLGGIALTLHAFPPALNPF